MATAANQPVQLEWSRSGDTVVVTPQDEDRFTIKLGRAVAILQQAQHAEEFRRQFNLLLRLLAEWLKETEGVKQAFVTHRDGALSFVVVREACAYDDAFEDRLSDLDYRIATDEDLNRIKMDAIALPPASMDALSSFLAPDFVMEYIDRGN